MDNKVELKLKQVFNINILENLYLVEDHRAKWKATTIKKKKKKKGAKTETRPPSEVITELPKTNDNNRCVSLSNLCLLITVA